MRACAGPWKKIWRHLRETVNGHDVRGTRGRRAKKVGRISPTFRVDLRRKKRCLSCSEYHPTTRCLMMANLLKTDSFSGVGCWTSFPLKRRASRALHKDCLRFENSNKTFHALNFSSLTDQISSAHTRI